MLTTQVWIGFIFDIILIVFALRFMWGMMRLGKISPFIRTRMPVAEEVAEAFGTLPEGSVLIDPGCGDGRVLFAIAKRNPHTTFIGIELRLLPYILALLEKRKHPDLNITFIHGNFFDQDLSSATHIYTYLYAHVMDSLLPKLLKELKPGTTLLSVDFPFSKKQTEHVTTLKSAEQLKLGRTLYVYRF
ncbi:MAG: hypothetical protein AB203_03230 [Parcubacteria bacterium C7867-008]|nr:MAG: hypothetical protein AB203_03230 [Parcubacteria bacterium C7867-008]